VNAICFRVSNHDNIPTRRGKYPMRKALLCLLLLASVVSASAANPSITISPSPVALHAGGTQQFTATFSDGSQVQSCTWLTTGSMNAVQGIGASTAIFAAGTLKATYVVTASCINTTGVPAMGIAVIAVT
jgi:hypothetical protein